MAEHRFQFYMDPSQPLVVEWSPDGIFWERTPHFDEQPLEGCPAALVREATVDVESGWIRAKNLLGNPARFDSHSNHIAVPEPAWIGVLSGLLMLFLAWRLHHGRRLR